MKKTIIKPMYISIFFLLTAILFVYEAISSQHYLYHFKFVGYGGTFKYHDLKVIGIPIYWFMLICGFVITLIISIKSRNKYCFTKFKSIIFPLIFLIISFLGAKLLFIIENINVYKFNGLQLDGMSLYGGIFLVLFITPLIAFCFGEKIQCVYDCFAPFGVMLLSTIRTGCFLNGCCEAKLMWIHNNPVILPVQLIEVSLDFLILESCFFVERKFPKQGFAYPISMLLYGICRFLLEFLRDTPKNTFNMSHGQIFSIISIVMSLFVIYIINKYNKINENGDI